MKVLLSIAFLFGVSYSFGQTITHYSDSTINTDTSVSVKHITTNEKTIHGKIDDKYDITIYLKFSNYSEANFHIYSVKGYYYYDKIKKNIPLVGLYDGDLTLYEFKSKEKQDNFLNFELNDTIGNFWDNIRWYKTLPGFEEKFNIDFSTSGTWIKNNKSHKLTFGTDNDLKILIEDEYICISSNGKSKMMDFKNLVSPEQNFELINFKKHNDEIKILLKYDYASRAYVLGQCGAGEEIGYIILNFDVEYKLINTTKLPIRSCNDNIEYEETETDNPLEKKLIITRYIYDAKSDTSNDEIKTVILNKKNVNITILK